MEMLVKLAYFLKQLHTDFKRVEKDVTEVKTTTALIKTEFKGINDLMNQKIEFLEKRVNHFELLIFKPSKNGKERNDLG
jgi:ppGpp synthetase/RelA/SpoT-type nucleotidyltranferase